MTSTIPKLQLPMPDNWSGISFETSCYINGVICLLKIFVPQQPVWVDKNGHTYEPYDDKTWLTAVVKLAEVWLNQHGSMDGYVFDPANVETLLGKHRPKATK